MKKLALNTVILSLAYLIPIFIFISVIRDIFGVIFVLIGGLFGFVFASILIKSDFAKKRISEKLLKYISYLIFIFTTILFTSFLIRTYSPHLINGYFADYNGDFYEFLNHYRFSHPTIPLFRFTIETLSFFFFFDLFFTNLGAGMLLAISSKIFSSENKKER